MSVGLAYFLEEVGRAVLGASQDLREAASKHDVKLPEIPPLPVPEISAIALPAVDFRLVALGVTAVSAAVVLLAVVLLVSRRRKSAAGSYADSSLPRRDAAFGGDVAGAWDNAAGGMDSQGLGLENDGGFYPEFGPDFWGETALAMQNKTKLALEEERSEDRRRRETRGPLLDERETPSWQRESELDSDTGHASERAHGRKTAELLAAAVVREAEAYGDGLPDSLSPQSRGRRAELGETLGLALAMLAHGSGDDGIARAILHRTGREGDARGAGEALALARTVREFAELVRGGHFDALVREKDAMPENKRSEGAAPLPEPAEALARLGKGDTVPALALLQAFAERKVDLASEPRVPEARRAALARQASVAGTMIGTLAALDDPRLAVEAHKLAVELAPGNMASLDALANLYVSAAAKEGEGRAEMPREALEIFRHIVDKADEKRFPAELADARRAVSEELAKSGVAPLEAALLGRQSRAFYESVDVLKPLGKPEREFVGAMADSLANGRRAAAAVESLLSGAIRRRLGREVL